MQKLLPTSLCLTVLGLGACLGDAPLPEVHTCTASIKAKRFHYEIKGDTLRISDEQAEKVPAILQDPAVTYERIEPTSTSSTDQTLEIYGTWRTGQGRATGKRVDWSLRVEPDKVTAISTCYFRDNVVLEAEVSSRAIVKDSVVEILEAARHTEEVTVE